MNFLRFKTQYQHSPLILSKALLNKNENKQTILNQLNRWNGKHLIVKLKRGIYLLNEHDRKIKPNNLFLANQLYSHSYVSLEYALDYYELINAKSTAITSVTIKKTAQFKNIEGEFVYKHIKPEAFQGFQMHKDENGLIFRLAYPEKALVDFIYLNLNQKIFVSRDEMLKVFHMKNLLKLSKRKTLDFTKLFMNQKLTRVVETIWKTKEGL